MNSVDTASCFVDVSSWEQPVFYCLEATEVTQLWGVDQEDEGDEVKVFMTPAEEIETPVVHFIPAETPRRSFGLSPEALQQLGFSDQKKERAGRATPSAQYNSVKRHIFSIRIPLLLDCSFLTVRDHAAPPAGVSHFVNNLISQKKAGHRRPNLSDRVNPAGGFPMSRLYFPPLDLQPT